MNFSELTNAFTVHLVEDDDNESRLALALYARWRYEDLGRTVCIALDDGQDLSAFEAAGFVEAKEAPAPDVQPPTFAAIRGVPGRPFQ